MFAFTHTRVPILEPEPCITGLCINFDLKINEGEKGFEDIWEWYL